MHRFPLSLKLLTLFGVLTSFTPLLAAHPRLHQAEDALAQASADGVAAADQQKDLESASTLLQAVFAGNQDHAHLAAAVKATNAALADLADSATPDTLKQDISEALTETRAELAVLEPPSTNTTDNSASFGTLAPPTNSDSSPVPAPPTPTPAPAPQPTPEETVAPGTLTESQARAVVLVKGDNAEGTGFLVKTADGPAVITNIHVISNNPNIKITTNTGTSLTILSYKGATDRDVAMIGIKAGAYSYLDLATDVSGTVNTGDEVITPGNSEGGEVMLNTDGKVLGIGPDRIEFDNPIYHGNSGGPVFHVKSGKVIALVTEAVKVDVTDELNKASFANRNSAISHTMRYFGMRIDNVPKWEPYDWRNFLGETAFLDQFDKRNRALDCYLNAPDDNKPDDILWQDDEKIMKANKDYFDLALGDADASQKADATRQLDGTLSDIAASDMETIQNSNNFYSFDQIRAKDEIAYRKALIAELNQINDNDSRLGSLPRTNNN